MSYFLLNHENMDHTTFHLDDNRDMVNRPFKYHK
jgi:hypothetical protein